MAAAFDSVTQFGQQHQWDVKLLSWAFLFVGERCFEGTRAFSTQGIDKAIFNLFRMYSKLGTLQVRLDSSGAVDPRGYVDICGRGEAADVSGFATVSSSDLAILIYHHHDDWAATGEVEIALDIENLSFEGDVLVTHYRIDDAHSNAYGEWVRQGKPMYPTPEQHAAITARSGLETIEQRQKVTPREGKVSLDFQLPVHGISLVIVSTES